jgi:isohexenylglutaconyl-CoA hydratase
MGLVHFVEHDAQALAERLDEILAHVLCCAPGANAVTKKLLLASAGQPSGGLLDEAAEWFSEAVTGEEGIEGTQAFVQKRKPGWAL